MRVENKKASVTWFEENIETAIKTNKKSQISVKFDKIIR